jgi:putative copper export protein
MATTEFALARLLSRHRERPTAPGRSLFLGCRCARLAGVKAPSRRTGIAAALFAALLSMMLSAPVALAENGVGLAGPTTDKTVTFFCFGVIAFFAILVIVLTLFQERLERRKERRRYDLQRYG